MEQIVIERKRWKCELAHSPTDAICGSHACRPTLLKALAKKGCPLPTKKSEIVHK